MTGPDDKSSSIPEWQQQSGSATPGESSASTQSSEEAPDSAPRDTLLWFLMDKPNSHQRRMLSREDQLDHTM